jgi:hypothetical protein
MFGASEDRARQLAYRKRKERIVSGSSCSMLRSLSSSSHVSQQSQISSIIEQSTSPSPLHAEHSSPHTGHTPDDMSIPACQTKSQDSECGAILATDTNHSQTEQHRLQFEHLTQVLYDSLSRPTTVRKPTAIPGPVTPSGNPEAPGQSTTARRIRSVTAPSVHSCLGPPILPTASPTAFNGSLGAHSMVSLRGGGEDNLPMGQEKSQLGPAPQRRQENEIVRTQQLQPASGLTSSLGKSLPQPRGSSQIYDPKRPYMVNYPWATRFCFGPAWMVPISTGPLYLVLMHTLPSHIVDQFLSLFGPMEPATPWSSPAANARRDLYVKLGHEGQVRLRNLISSRHAELLAIEKGGADPELNPSYPGMAGLMLHHLMEATEPPYSPSYYSMESFAGRSTSAPNAGQQQGYAAYLSPAIH